MAKELTYEELLAQNTALKKQTQYLSEQAEELSSEIKELKALNDWYKEQLKLSKKKLFGSSSEKAEDGYEQINLFNEAEAERQPIHPEPQIEEVIVPSHKRRKKCTFEEKYGDLPVEEVLYDLPEKEKTCEKCGSEMTFMKYEIRRELKIIPAEIKVVEHKKAVYVCKDCDKNGIESNFKTAEAVPALMEKSLASPSLLAHLMNQKFCNAMPLYRQEQELRRMGVKLSRQTMSNWMIAGAGLLKPLYGRMHEILVSKKILHADETPLEVLCEPNRPAQIKSYMWVYRTGKRDAPIVLYDYEEGRSGEFAKKFLSGFSGYLHCDGWAGYDKVPDIKRVGCFAHVRRKFLEALEVQEDKKDLSTIAGQGFLYIEKLFSLEKPEFSPEKIQEIRTEKSRPLLEEFFSWAGMSTENCTKVSFTFLVQKSDQVTTGD